MSTRAFTLTEIHLESARRLRLVFADGADMWVDLHPIIERHPVLRPLLDDAVFRTARLGEWGASVVWGDSDSDGDLELAADNLRARAVEQAGGCSHEFIWNWMSRHRLTLDQAARALGLSRRMLAYYRSGQRPVPLTVALACLGWEQIKGDERFLLAA
jgi:predicted DNA-binding transcriptional regulator AlpA